MRVIIVGAGIAGLSAAIGLRRAGHDVQILEKSSMLEEVGAAIHVQPNATRVLMRWDFDVRRARLVTSRSALFVHGDSLKAFSEQYYKDIEKKYGAEFYLSHRVDLHNELKRLATRVDGPGRPAEVLLKKEVRGYDPEAGLVEVADGTTMKADLIIGADGIHSVAVKHIIGYNNPAIPKGLSCFRFLLPSQDLIDDPQTESLMENHEGKARYYVVAQGKNTKRIVWYPCRDNQMQNLAIIIPDKVGLDSEEGWDFEADLDTLMNEIKDFHPTLQAACRKAEDLKLYKLLFRAPLPTWHKSRLVVIGDAAHPMLPFQGQAGAQAIEDGAALGVVFSNFSANDPTSISNQLQLFENIRRNRASVMQMLSNAGQDEAAKVRESVLPYMPEGNIPTNPAEYTEHNFRHDVFAACEAEMSKVNQKS